MRACGIFLLICVALVLTKTASADGPCEKIENHIWHPLIGTRKYCFIESTTINSKNFSITSDRDVTVGGFRARDNKNLKYLPNNLGSKFPNLLVLYASRCSVKEISKDNFDGLGKLRFLWLHKNEIEKIDDDSFEHIAAVELISLYDNKIKKLNGRAFASLHKLVLVYLHDNECIDEFFETAEGIADMPRVVTEKCGFIDPEISSTKTAKPEADLMEQSEEMQALKLEIAKLRIEKAEADLQIAHHNEIKAQLKETCDVRIELKVQENSNCSNDLQARTAEINEKNDKIKQLEEKIQVQGCDGP